jgi:guanosine-3',5'-bis(diphosphate) 3'-pyrophosphohydrolase
MLRPASALARVDAHDNPERRARPSWPARRLRFHGRRHLNLVPLFAALDFAAHQHRKHRRKDAEASPYVNHLIAVGRILVEEGGVDDPELVVAAVLHDTVEDTETSFDELAARFGPAVTELVREVTDDKSLDKDVRKQLQIERAPHASPRAKQLKIADKIANLRDILATPPTEWSLERKRDYVDWAELVVAGCRGFNPPLERAFDALAARARVELG